MRVATAYPDAGEGYYEEKYPAPPPRPPQKEAAFGIHLTPQEAKMASVS